MEALRKKLAEVESAIVRTKMERVANDARIEVLTELLNTPKKTRSKTNEK